MNTLKLTCISYKHPALTLSTEKKKQMNTKLEREHNKPFCTFLLILLHLFVSRFWQEQP